MHGSHDKQAKLCNILSEAPTHNISRVPHFKIPTKASDVSSKLSNLNLGEENNETQSISRTGLYTL